MTQYREIFRLKELGLSKFHIALCIYHVRNTVARVLAIGKELGIKWPREASDIELQQQLFSNETEPVTEWKMPDFDYIHKKLRKKSVTTG